MVPFPSQATIDRAVKEFSEIGEQLAKGALNANTVYSARDDMVRKLRSEGAAVKPRVLKKRPAAAEASRSGAPKTRKRHKTSVDGEEQHVQKVLVSKEQATEEAAGEKQEIDKRKRTGMTNKVVTGNKVMASWSIAMGPPMMQDSSAGAGVHPPQGRTSR